MFLKAAFPTFLFAVALAACDGSKIQVLDNEPAVTTLEPSPPNQETEVTVQAHHTLNEQRYVRYTSVEDGTWPPQPLNAVNVAVYQPLRINQEKQSLAGLVTPDFLATSDVSETLGRNYASFDHVNNNTKSKPFTESTYFNYNTNKSVVISVYPNDSVKVKAIPATHYQPPENKEEINKAISLAARALEKQGYQDIKKLIGTALLAHPTSMEIAETGSPFYSERKLYVTFGPGAGETPHYRALVNLSTNSVSNARPIQR